MQEGDEVLQIERVRLADDEPLGVELLYLDAKRFDGIVAVLGESQSVYQLLRAGYGVELAWAEETIEAVVAPEREADLLGIPAGAPVLLRCRQSFDSNGIPVEFVRSVYRADRFRFRTRLQPVVTTPAAPLPPGTRLRLATPADAPGLARVFVSAWRAGYVGIVAPAVLDSLDEEDIADWLGTLTASNGPTTWLAESAAGEILAFSRHGEDPVDSRRGHIFSLYVAPEASGRGLAKALLEHDLGLLAERGLRTVTLWVFEENRAARNLYASFGFVPDGGRRVEPEYGAQEVRLRRDGGGQGGGRARGGGMKRAVSGRVRRRPVFSASTGEGAQFAPGRPPGPRGITSPLYCPRVSRPACPWPSSNPAAWCSKPSAGTACLVGRDRGHDGCDPLRPGLADQGRLHHDIGAAGRRARGALPSKTPW